MAAWTVVATSAVFVLPAAAADTSPLSPKEELVHGSIALTAGAASLAFIGLKDYDRSGWRGPILIDEPIQDLLMPDSEGVRLAASRVSDVTLGATVVAPLALSIAGADFGDDLTIAAESMLLTTFVTSGVKYLVGRERPDGGKNDSFFSGHTSAAFAGAGLACSGTIGPRGPDGVPEWVCPTALSAASLTGILRITGGRHYFSDVVVGAGVGLLFGYAFPRWVHGQDGERQTDSDDETDGKKLGAGMSVSPVFAAGGAGAMLRVRW